MTAPFDPMAEIRATYFEECEELIETLQIGLGRIATDADDLEAINLIFRGVHSIKGGAGAFGFDVLVQFSHYVEALLDQLRDGQLRPTQEILCLLYQSADHLSDVVRATRGHTSIPDDISNILISKINTTLQEQAIPDCDKELPITDSETIDHLDNFTPNLEISFHPFAEFFETGNEPATLLGNLAKLGEVEVICETAKLPPFEQLAPETPYLSWHIKLQTECDEAKVYDLFEFVEGLCSLDVTKPHAAKVESRDRRRSLERPPANPIVDHVEKNASSSTKPAALIANQPTVRVDLDRVEKLVDLVGELVINQSMLSQNLDQLGLPPHGNVAEGVINFQRLTREIQDSVMSIRAQPLKSLFQRMARIIRQASTGLEKEICLTTTGETTEVDKTVIERLVKPLTHLVRNAIDHGLEKPKDRLEACKEPQGNVSLSAAHRSGRLIIEISDDGSGIDRARVQEKAVANGLLLPDSELSESEIDNLIWLPGFTTADQVSEMSGRGVGMDVVRTSIQEIGGRITTISQPGVGTTFRISLPLTLAVLDGMVVEVAGETLVVPISSLVEALSVRNSDVKIVCVGQMMVQVRGVFLPVIDLGFEMGYRQKVTSYEDATMLIITDERDNRAALVIDNILEHRQVVVKGLNEQCYPTRWTDAATILGSGRIALIIDSTEILETAFSSNRMGPAPSRKEVSLG